MIRLWINLIYNLIKPSLKNKYKDLCHRDLEMIAENMFRCMEDLVLFDAFFVRNNRKNYPSRKIDRIFLTEDAQKKLNRENQTLNLFNW